MKLCISGNWKLVDQTGNVVSIGQQITTFVGKRCTLEGATPPHNSHSTGRILTSQGEVYPSVCDLLWVEEPEELTMLNACKLALKLVKDHWIFEHGREDVGVTWGALETAIAKGDALTDGQPQEQLYHVVSINNTTATRTPMTLYPMTQSQCNVFRGKLMASASRRIEFEPVAQPQQQRRAHRETKRETL